MTDVTFTDGLSEIDSAWLNPINHFFNDVFDGATTKAGASAAIGGGGGSSAASTTYDPSGVPESDTDVQSAVSTLSGKIAANTSETASKAPLTSPVFSGEIGLGSARLDETEVGVLEGIGVTTTQLNTLDTITGNVQTQLNGLTSAVSSKIGAASPVFSGTLTLGATNVTAVELGIVEGATTTTAQLNNINTTTSDVQTQLNTHTSDLTQKSDKSNPTFSGEIGLGSVNVSETELGILEGATTTTAQLNNINTTTSNVQSQIDSISSSGFSRLKAWAIVDMRSGSPVLVAGHNVDSVALFIAGSFFLTLTAGAVTDENMAVPMTVGKDSTLLMSTSYNILGGANTLVITPLKTASPRHDEYTILAGDTSVATGINSSSPGYYQLTALNDMGAATKAWLTSPGNTNITINVDTAPLGSGAKFTLQSESTSETVDTLTFTQVFE